MTEKSMNQFSFMSAITIKSLMKWFVYNSGLNWLSDCDREFNNEAR